MSKKLKSPASQSSAPPLSKGVNIDEASIHPASQSSAPPLSKGVCIPAIETYLKNLQDQISAALEKTDGAAKFHEDAWQHKNGGGGRTRVIQNGAVFEKGGVNFSHVKGSQLPKSATLQRPELIGCDFEAMGVSLVMHPHNPLVPTTHLNVRFFMANTKNGPVWWFGGGYDLTPYYGFDEDCRHWHQIAKQACDPFGLDIYPKFKKQCDEYFYLKHRNEPRGIGGLFFDDFNELGFDESFAFMRSVGDSFLPAYLPIVERRKNTEFSDEQRQFQLYRRGRYVEFNLVYDRGTLFGLQSGGRTESILMSLPPLVRFDYDTHFVENTRERELYDKYLVAKDWL